jgi:hypothetical protein
LFPKVFKDIPNKKGTNFYNFDAEKAFREALDKDIDFDKKEVFNDLIKNVKEVNENEL